MYKIEQQKDILQRVSERTGKDPELIKFVINHMWSEIRANVITPKTWKTMVNNFGIFQPKEKKINFILSDANNKKLKTTSKIEEFKRLLDLKTKQ